MNCKPGDLAIVVKSEFCNEGKIVTCIRLASDADLAQYGYGSQGWVHWLVDRVISSGNGRPCPFMPDKYLRPIRPGEGEDEMLRIAGKPTEVTAWI